MKTLCFYLKSLLWIAPVTFFSWQHGSFDLRAEDFSGSVSLSVEQRFFDDDRLGRVNGFSQWGAYHFDLTVGLHEYSFGLEPIINLGLIQNTASLFALDDDGNVVRQDGEPLKSEDTLDYTILSSGVGARWRAWEKDFFLVSPVLQAQLIYRFAFVTKNTSAVGQQTKNKGGDFGADLAGGLYMSFFFEESREAEMRHQWDLKDYGLIVLVRYLPAGWFKHGLGLVENTGGWSFGGGLSIDW